MEILKVNNLNKKFRDKRVLKNISFSIEKSEIVGFLGRNGSGKSTTMKCISGLMGFDNGKVRVCGFDIKKERIKALENMGVSIESPALYPNLSAYDHYQQMAAWRKVSKSRVDEMIAFSNLGIYLKKPVKTYSMGMKMRLMLSLVIMHKPNFLILDEPMNGLDFEGILKLREVLIDLKNNGSSILLSSHQLSELEKLSDRIIMIEDGEIVFNDKMTENNLGISKYSIDTIDNKTLIEILGKKRIKNSMSINPSTINYVSFKLKADKIGELIEDLYKKDIYIKDIVKENLGLEELYQNIIEAEKK